MQVLQCVIRTFAWIKDLNASPPTVAAHILSLRKSSINKITCIIKLYTRRSSFTRHKLHVKCVSRSRTLDLDYMSIQWRSDASTDISPGVLADIASDPLTVRSSGSSMTWNTGWTREDGCIIRADLRPRGRSLLYASLGKPSQVCGSHSHLLIYPFQFPFDSWSFIPPVDGRAAREHGVCFTRSSECEQRIQEGWNELRRFMRGRLSKRLRVNVPVNRYEAAVLPPCAWHVYLLVSEGLLCNFLWVMAPLLPCARILHCPQFT